MRKFKRIVSILITLFLLITTMLYFLQEKFIFRPNKLPETYVFDFSEPFEEIFLDTSDGARLNGIHFKRKNPKGVILYFHGNAGDLSRWGKITSYFAKKNYDVVVMDYRTFGKSRGALNEENLFADAQLFYDYTLENYSEERIIVYGRSLGASIASHMVSKPTNNPAKLILETPFYNLYDVAKSWFPFLPVKTLLKYRFESNKVIKNVKCPVTILHGTQDAVVPYESGKKLFDTVKSEKEFLTIEGGGHNNLVEFSTYEKNIDRILSIK